MGFVVVLIWECPRICVGFGLFFRAGGGVGSHSTDAHARRVVVVFSFACANRIGHVVDKFSLRGQPFAISIREQRHFSRSGVDGGRVWLSTFRDDTRCCRCWWYARQCRGAQFSWAARITPAPCSAAW